MLAAAAMLGTCDYARAQNGQDKVIDVRVEGNRRMTTEAVLAHVKTRLGQSYSDDLVRSDKQALLDTAQFTSVVATKTQTDRGVIVTFIVQERPLVSRVMLQGNKEFTDEQLMGSLPFQAAAPLNIASVQAGQDALVNKYRSSGYYFASVTVDRPALEKEKRAVYKIVEGPRVTIGKVEFVGNTTYSGLILGQKVGTRKRFWPIFPGFLDTDQLAQDVTALRNFYRDEGFLDAEVGRELEFSFDKTQVTVRFIVKEGPRYRVNEVIFKGNTVISAEQLAQRVSLQQGSFFTAERLKQSVQNVQDTYGEVGYIEAQVRATRQFLAPSAPVPAWAAGMDEGAAKPAVLNIVFTIVEKDQYRIGQINIRGNNITQGRIIRRELRFFPEQIFNSTAVKESKNRLEETRLFEKVEIEPVATNVPGVRNADVIVKEGRTAQFLVGVGVSTNAGLLGNISFTQRNFDLFAPQKGFRGGGQTLSIVAEPGTEMMRFYVDWFEPYLFDQPYSLGARGFAWTRKREDWDETRVGGLMTVGHKFINHWFGQVATRVEAIDISDVSTDTSTEIRDEEGWHSLVGIKPALIRDRTDSRWLPSKGDRLELSYEQVFGTSTFGNIQGEYHYYHTLATDALDRKHILASRVAAGQIVGDAPFFERYYGGGIGSIRGFKYRGISPRGSNGDDPIGGDFMFFAGSEYSFPLIGKDLRGVLFVDTGTVNSDFGFSNYRMSIGTGLRWVVPMLGPVPLSLDVAVPILKGDDDDTQILSFSVGVTF
ncbi:MAG: outer membrane protein assembly factor BamA [Planctomycetaceae bacterium]|nr:outer membrane protein assembly factor BamA [Planctomycetaceae bacterium]